MVLHYLKIAFRNLLKYRTQSIISTLGLAIGFTCFALAVLWIRYEMTYDNFHEGAERTFLVRVKSKVGSTGLSQITPYPLAGYLKENFPEIEASCNYLSASENFLFEGINHKLNCFYADSASVNMFTIEMITGNKDFLIEKNHKIAITEAASARLFGPDDPIGKVLENYGEKYTICAIVKPWAGHSNIPYDIIKPNYAVNIWEGYSWRTAIRLRKGIDTEAFANKLYDHKVDKDNSILTDMVLTSFLKVRYDRNDSGDIQVKFNHIILFSIAGILVICCALFNYLTVFISRVRLRVKEMALRKICGSSSGGIFALFSIEFLLNLFLSMTVGMMLIEISLSSFRQLSGVETTKGGMYIETIGYVLVIIGLAFLMAQIPFYYFRKQALQVSIRNAADGRKRNTFRKVSFAFQLVISIGFIFCTIVMMKQLYYLVNTDIGMERKNIASFSTYPAIDAEVSGTKIAQLHMVTQVMKGHYGLIPKGSTVHWLVKEWEDKPAGAENISMEVIVENEEYCNFYGLTLVEGVMLTPDDTDEKVMINEKAVQALGWSNPLGKKLMENSKVVVGVIKDFYNESPTIPVKPVAFVRKTGYESFFRFGKINDVLFKYREGAWEECKSQIEEWVKKEYPNTTRVVLVTAEEEYDKYLMSEYALLKLLGFVSIVCVIIAVFGIFSIVTLSCEQRRKEIAIRKVNGASIGNVLQMFLKEYFVVLVISAAIAFPLGYSIMKTWLENYVKQTEISFWIYIGILIGVLLVIIISIGWRVWKAANQNPAEVIKNE